MTSARRYNYPLNKGEVSFAGLKPISGSVRAIVGGKGNGAGKDNCVSMAELSKQNGEDLSEGYRSFASQWTHNLQGPVFYVFEIRRCDVFRGGHLSEQNGGGFY